MMPEKMFVGVLILSSLIWVIAKKLGKKDTVDPIRMTIIGSMFLVAFVGFIVSATFALVIVVSYLKA